MFAQGQCFISCPKSFCAQLHVDPDQPGEDERLPEQNRGVSDRSLFKHVLADSRAGDKTFV